jgi:RNA 2',3'-cyclic 3'-phosphodiesterase
MLRLFFALQPTLEFGTRLVATAAPLLTELGAQPVPVSNLHATLCFIGAVEPERLDALRAAAVQVHALPFQLEFDTFEYWEKPRILVAAATQESLTANALSRALQEAASAAGFSPDVKPFRAHLTLARKISPTAAQKISWPLKISPGFVVFGDRFALMKSHRGEQGSIYSVVDEWRLYESSIERRES